MLMIGEVLVEEEIASERFSCDLAKCKGACCTIPGGRGAPLADEEKELIERYFPAVRKHLSARNLRVIERKGLTDGFDGNYATTCVDDRDCVFVTWEGDVAKCSFEIAFHDGEIPWRKPLSCHLFPLRYSGGTPGMVRYEPIGACSPARERGRADAVPLHEFLKEAIIRRLGADWYARFAHLDAESAASATDTSGT
jgi:hypothetical protein